MKLLIVAHAFAPSIGGVETVSRILAEQLTQLGHQVTVLTTTPEGPEPLHLPYAVVRNPGRAALLRLLHGADGIIESHITLGFTWPLYLAKLLHLPTTLGRKPLVSVMHTPELKPGQTHTRANRLKHFILRRTRPYAVSEYLLNSQGIEGRVMPNPYDDAVFRSISVVAEPPHFLLFVGRLTAAKGCDVAIEALAILNSGSLAQPGRAPFHLSIVGCGEDEPALRQQAAALGLEDYVHFLGVKSGHALAEIMNAHCMVLLPSRSRPPEAFALVSLEAIACGCIPIGSHQGGLPESIGPCGLTFPEGDSLALACTILQAMHQKLGGSSENDSVIMTHLQKHLPVQVAERYLEAIAETRAAILT
jgi:glycogen(starch) synthase